MNGTVAPMLSVIVTDDEIKDIVINGIDCFLQSGYCYGSWQYHVEQGTDDYIALLERLRIAYNIKV